MSDESDNITRRIVIAYLHATQQDDAADNLEAYLGRDEGWNGSEPEGAQPVSRADAGVPDSLTWGRALLDFIRNLPPVQAACVGAIEVSPPWWSAVETMPIGKIANMLEIAESGELHPDEHPDWGWFPHNPPSWEIFLRGAPAFTPFPPRRQP